VAIDLRRGKVTSLEKSQELLLEFAAGFLFDGIVKLDGQSKSRNSSPSLASLQQVDDFNQIKDLLDFCLSHGVPKSAG